jgi:hypothetical protein
VVLVKRGLPPPSPAYLAARSGVGLMEKLFLSIRKRKPVRV